MAHYFFDTGALVKRHVIEAGSPWVKSLVRAKAAHTLYIARITAIEVTSAITPAANAPAACRSRKAVPSSAISAAISPSVTSSIATREVFL